MTKARSIPTASTIDKNENVLIFLYWMQTVNCETTIRFVIACIYIFVRVLLNEWGSTPLYCYAIPVYESIRSAIQLIYLIYRHEPRKIKHENIKITHCDEWWIWWWCNKATQRENNNKFLITVFSVECRIPNVECRMPNAVPFISSRFWIGIMRSFWFSINILNSSVVDCR